MYKPKSASSNRPSSGGIGNGNNIKTTQPRTTGVTPSSSSSNSNNKHSGMDIQKPATQLIRKTTAEEEEGPLLMPLQTQDEHAMGVVTDDENNNNNNESESTDDGTDNNNNNNNNSNGKHKSPTKAGIHKKSSGPKGTRASVLAMRNAPRKKGTMLNKKLGMCIPAGKITSAAKFLVGKDNTITQEAGILLPAQMNHLCALAFKRAIEAKNSTSSGRKRITLTSADIRAGFSDPTISCILRSASVFTGSVATPSQTCVLTNQRNIFGVDHLPPTRKKEHESQVAMRKYVKAKRKAHREAEKEKRLLKRERAKQLKTSAKDDENHENVPSRKRGRPPKTAPVDESDDNDSGNEWSAEESSVSSSSVSDEEDIASSASSEEEEDDDDDDDDEEIDVGKKNKKKKSATTTKKKIEKTAKKQTNEKQKKAKKSIVAKNPHKKQRKA